jgi:putative transposase
VTWAIEEKSYSQRRACALVGLHPKTYRYASTRPDDSALRAKLRELASQRRRFGYRRLGRMLERRGIKLNAKGSVRNLVCEAMMMGSEGASHGDREGLA